MKGRQQEVCPLQDRSSEFFQPYATHKKRTKNAVRTSDWSPVKGDLPRVPDPQPSDLLTLTPPRQTKDLVGGGWPQDCHIVFRNYNMIFVLDITMRIGYHISRIFILWSSTMH